VRHSVHLADMPALEHCVVLAQQRAVMGLRTCYTRSRIRVVQTTRPQSSAHDGDDPHDRDTLTLVNNQRVITAHTAGCGLPGGVDGAYAVPPRDTGRYLTRFQTSGA